MNSDSDSTTRDFEDADAAKRVLAFVETLAQSRKTRAFIVGGAVRDHLLKCLNRGTDLSVIDALRDLDIVIEDDARNFALVANETLNGSLQVFDRFFTAKISHPAAFPGVKEIDFASTRTEIYERPGSLPTVKISTLEDDLRRRDFSINALAVPLSKAASLISLEAPITDESIIDQFGACQDLRLRQLRVLHSKSFIDDPTRLFRAIRYSVRLGFNYDPETGRLFAEAIKSHALKTVSAARIFTEIRKILLESKSAEMLIACVEHSLLDNWTPRLALSNAELVELICNLPAGARENEFLKLICQRDPAAQPQGWGLSLSKKTVKQLMARE